MKDMGVTDLERTSSISCGTCGKEIPRGETLRVSTAPGLPDDPALGAGVPLRFLPSRFDETGTAIDPGGASCPVLACPDCRAALPGPESVRLNEGSRPPLIQELERLEGVRARGNWTSVEADSLSAACRRLEHELNITTDWIADDLFTEPIAYSMAAGNLVVIADRLDRLAEQTQLTPRPDWAEGVDRLNQHHLAMSEVRKPLNRIRAAYERGDNPVELILAWKRLRRAAPRLTTVPDTIRGLEHRLATWLRADGRTHEELRRAIELLDHHRPLTELLARAEEHVRADWSQRERFRTVAALEREHESIDPAVDRIEAIESLAQRIQTSLDSGGLPPGIDWAARARELREVAADRRAAIERQIEGERALSKLERTLDEGAGLRQIETDYARARDLLGPLGSVLEARVRRRLEIERSTRHRRIAVIAVIGVMLAVTSAIFVWNRIEQSRRDTLISGVVTESDAAIAAGTPSIVAGIIENVLVAHPELTGDTRLTSLGVRAAKAVEDQDAAIEDACRRLQEAITALDEGGGLADARRTVTAISSEGIPRSDGEFEACLADANDRIEQTMNDRRDATVRAIAIPLDGATMAFEEIEANWPSLRRDRRFDARAWQEAADGLAEEIAVLDLALLDHAESLADLREWRRRVDELMERMEARRLDAVAEQKRLEMGLAAIRELNLPARSETEFRDRLKRVSIDNASLLQELSQFSEIERSLALAESAVPLAAWRDTYWLLVTPGFNSDANLQSRRGALDSLREYNRIHPAHPMRTELEDAVTLLDLDGGETRPRGENIATELRRSGLAGLSRLGTRLGWVYLRANVKGRTGYLLTTRDLRASAEDLPDGIRGVSVVGSPEASPVSMLLSNAIDGLAALEGVECGLELLDLLERVRLSDDVDPLLVLAILEEGWRIWERDFARLDREDPDGVRPWLRSLTRDFAGLMQHDWVKSASEDGQRMSRVREATEVIDASPRADRIRDRIRSRVAAVREALRPTTPVGVAAAGATPGSPRSVAWLDGVVVTEDVVTATLDPESGRIRLQAVSFNDAGEMMPVAGTPTGPLLLMRRQPATKDSP